MPTKHKRELAPFERQICSSKLKSIISTFTTEEARENRLSRCVALRQAILLAVSMDAAEFVHTAQASIRVAASDVSFDDILSRVPDSMKADIKEHFDVGFGLIMACTRDGFFCTTYYEIKLKP